ncbi:pilus assembly PilX N-terminal domain-containing protein [Candidatus Uhrbacteria bacterium]|nr:pilus assembly PilX N-terminal domain-containing protein [Candidatus Uhrbacteria bacterium]
MDFCKERGGTVLIVALIVMSSVTISALGLSSLIINSLQQTTVLDQAAIAFYAAETGVERTIWEIRRSGEFESSLPESIAMGDGVGLPNGSAWSREVYGDEPEINLSIPANGFSELHLFEPTEILGSLNQWSMDRGGETIDSLEVDWDWNPEVPCDPLGDCPVLFAEWLRWSPDSLDVDPFNVTLPGILPFTRRYLPGSVARIPPLGEDPDFPSGLGIPQYAYRVRLRAEYSDLRNVTVRAYNQFGDQVNIPGRAVIDSWGRFGNTTQRLTVRIPRKIPLSPLFSFAVFSECSLVKGYSISCP